MRATLSGSWARLKTYRRGDAIAGASRALNLCGKTSLEDVIDLLAACEQAVSNDSGLMHIAAAVGIHVHGIYGSSSPKFYASARDKPRYSYVGAGLQPVF